MTITCMCLDGPPEDRFEALWELKVIPIVYHQFEILPLIFWGLESL